MRLTRFLHVLNEARHQWETDEFQLWFGDSVVRDTRGNPLRVYHGTYGDFDTFSHDDVAYRGGILAFFSTNPKFASNYAATSTGGGGRVMPCYLRIEHPFDYRRDWVLVDNFYADTGGIQDDMEANRILQGLGHKAFKDETVDIMSGPGAARLTKAMFERAVRRGHWPALEAFEFVEWLRREGFDGIITRENRALNYAVFEPNQIKSASGNHGGFSDSPSVVEATDSFRINAAPRTMMSNYLRFIELVPVEWLMKLSGNSQRRSPEEMDQLDQDIRVNGIKDPVVLVVGKISRTAKLGEGNHRLMLARKNGIRYLPARVEVGSEYGSDVMAPGTLDADLIPVAGKYFPAQAAPSEVFRSLAGLVRELVTETTRRVHVDDSYTDDDPIDLTVLVNPTPAEIRAMLTRCEWKQLRAAGQGTLLYLWRAEEVNHAEVVPALKLGKDAHTCQIWFGDRGEARLHHFAGRASNQSDPRYAGDLEWYRNSPVLARALAGWKVTYEDNRDHLNEAIDSDQDLVRAAIQHFGITHDYRECGYIVPYRVWSFMLDLSGRHEHPDYEKIPREHRYISDLVQNRLIPGKRFDDFANQGARYTDHRSLGELMPLSNPEGSDGTTEMIEFMRRTGAIRVMPGIGISVARVPPLQSMIQKAFRGHYAWYDRQDPFQVDITLPSGQTIAKDFTYRNSPATVLAWITKAYAGRLSDPS